MSNSISQVNIESINICQLPSPKWISNHQYLSTWGLTRPSHEWILISSIFFNLRHLHFKSGNWYHHRLSIWVPITATFQTFAIERWVRMVERMKGLAMLLEIISFFHLHCSWEEPSCEGGLCQGSTMMVRQTIILFRICILGEKHFDIW